MSSAASAPPCRCRANACGECSTTPSRFIAPMPHSRARSSLGGAPVIESRRPAVCFRSGRMNHCLGLEQGCIGRRNVRQALLLSRAQSFGCRSKSGCPRAGMRRSMPGRPGGYRPCRNHQPSLRRESATARAQSESGQPPRLLWRHAPVQTGSHKTPRWRNTDSNPRSR
jgi:hypothetical protein